MKDEALQRLDDLAAFWKRLDLSRPPYIHPDDRPFFAQHRPRDLNHPPLDALSYERDSEAKHKNFTHLSLLPVPYLGDLQRANIFVLMLNPGFTDADYVEEANPDVVAALQASLRQEFAADGYPFWYLDPRFHRHPGHVYWRSRLNDVGAHKLLSHRVAVIQRFPYHSVKFGHSSIAKNLPSSLAATRFVRSIILPRVKRQEALLIVARAATAFGFSACDEAANLIVYGHSESHGGWLTSNSRGGAAISNWLNNPSSRERA
jgi:hypothetical protein